MNVFRHGWTDERIDEWTLKLDRVLADIEVTTPPTLSMPLFHQTVHRPDKRLEGVQAAYHHIMQAHLLLKGAKVWDQ